MKIPFFGKKEMHPPAFLSRFDSATDLTGALNAYLNGKEHSKMGSFPLGKYLAPLINNLPDNLKQNLYFYGGILDSTSTNKIDAIDAEEISRWIYHVHPQKKFPAIAIGSANGALNHLFAALGIPWLSNTFLIPIYRGKNFSIDNPGSAIDWSMSRAEIFLKNNPEWALYQMMDPVHDRLRAGSIAYFRVKKLVLGQWYKKIISDFLAPGGTIFIIDCKLSWPTIKLGDRHTFQFGGLGDIKPEEYYYGSDRIRDFLINDHAPVKKWDVPEPDSVSPEAEWGMNRELMKDINEFSEAGGYKQAKISFNHPQEPSPIIADMIREWNRNKNQPSQRLLVESFNVHSPWLVMSTRSVPYWLFFNTNPAAESIEAYLNQAKPYDEIFMMILSHGKESVGGVGIDRWRSIQSKARKNGRFVGVDTQSYPLDLGMYAHYKQDLKKLIPDKYPADQMTLAEFEDKYAHFLNDRSVTLKYKVL
jgi:hypothetical protein